MKEFMKKNKENIIIGIVSLAAFILGCISINPFLSFLIIGSCDAILFAPLLIQKVKKKEKKTHINHPKQKIAKEVKEKGEPPKKEKSKEKKSKEKKKKDKKKKKMWKKIIKILIVIFFICCFLGFIAVGLFINYIAKNAPTFNPNNLYKQESSVLYDVHGNAFAKLGAQKRENITYEDLPEVLINAIVATEDSRFFEHSGVDWARFIKATLQQLAGIDAGGASTITMQVSKNDVSQDKTSKGMKGIIRKFTDVYMSLEQIEKKYTKQEIMEFYVNSYYLGGGAYGVEQASQTYFGKSVSDINLAEASILAGLFQLPGKYNPLVNPEATEQRRKTVLNLMVRHGYITEEEKKAALAIPVTDLLVKKHSDSEDETKYLSFINALISELEEDFKENGNPYANAMEIWTTMDPDKQNYINDIMSGESWKWENEEVTAGIAVIDTQTGAIQAIGGGRPEKTVKRGFNTAVDTKNQIGSTAKPLYDYGPGIEYENWSTYDPFVDEKYTYSNGKTLNNWDMKYEGFVTARTALAHSRNISALKAFQMNKNENVKKFVTNLGLHPEGSGGSIHEAHSIGGYTGESPLSMAAAYASFGNGGYYIEPYSYTKVTFRNTGETVENKSNKKRAMGEDTAYMVYDMLKSSAKYGLGNQYNVNGATYGAKTGTTNFDEATKKAKGIPANAINDYWVNGVSPDYTISVWYGYETVHQTKDSSKPNYCKKCFNMGNEIYHRKLFQKVAQGFFKKGSDIKMPSSVIKVEIENETYPAKLPSEFTPSDMKVTELFKKGTEPTEVSTRYAKLENVTDAKGSVENNIATLSWTPIKTPEAIDEEALQKFFSTFWKNTAIPLNERKEYNNKYIGSVVYKIYAVGADGTLSLIDTTANTTSSFQVTTNSTDTYIIKSSYSIFSSNASDGTTVKLELGNVKPIIRAELIGTNPYVWTGAYTEDGVSVFEDDKDVTLNATITTKYINSVGGEITIDLLNTPGTYTAEYTITYKDFTNVLKRTIVIP